MDERTEIKGVAPTADPQALAEAVRGWVGYLRELGVYDLHRREEGLSVQLTDTARRALLTRAQAATQPAVRATTEVPSAARGSRTPAPPSKGEGPGTVATRPGTAAALPASRPLSPAAAEAAEPKRAYFMTEEGTPALPPELAAPMPKPNPLEALLPRPTEAIAPAQKAEALKQLQAEIGDCTRCPLAYAGRHTIVFGEGDPDAALMFVGEGPGADEDASGRPFVGKAGQLLDNMIGAMGLKREQVYIANVVRCRPPGNRAPEFVEATTCSQFLLRQIDIVQPRVIVALGATAATYVLGVRQSLGSLRGEWFRTRDAKVAVTYHPAFLLRDPRQKGEAWKDLQRVMAELGLQSPGRGA